MAERFFVAILVAGIIPPVNNPKIPHLADIGGTKPRPFKHIIEFAKLLNIRWRLKPLNRYFFADIRPVEAMKQDTPMPLVVSKQNSIGATAKIVENLVDLSSSNCHSHVLSFP